VDGVVVLRGMVEEGTTIREIEHATVTWRTPASARNAGAGEPAEVISDQAH
jgi:hypothetical protein